MTATSDSSVSAGGVPVRAARPIRWAVTWATAHRVLAQLRHDPRTVGLLIAVPAVLMVLLRYVLDNQLALNRFAPAFIGVFPFVVMFIVAAITTQRERARGTLERLMAMPLAKLDLLAGYAIAFGAVACVQVGVVLVVSLTWLGVQLPGTIAPLAIVAVLDALLGMSLGLFASAFARTEFQAVQFMPAFVLPQALLCGLIVARDQMTDVLRWLSDAMPMSYAVDAMQQIAGGASWSGPVLRDIAVILVFTSCALIGGALTLRRRTS
jgi:ABC-2 type transport system permease protein